MSQLLCASQALRITAARLAQPGVLYDANNRDHNLGISWCEDLEVQPYQHCIITAMPTESGCDEDPVVALREVDAYLNRNGITRFSDHNPIELVVPRLLNAARHLEQQGR